MEWTVATFLLANFILILGSILQMATGFFMMPGFIIGVLIASLFVKYFNPKYTKTVVLGMATFGALVLIGKSIV